MAKDCEVVTVQILHPVPLRGPVLYASLPSDYDPHKGDETKHRLVSILWDHLMAMDSPLRELRHPVDSANFPTQVVSGLLGRPHLQLGKYQGPAISFSKGGGKVWAALCGDESDIGIDVAGSDEFQGDYPFQRVFHPQELHHALRLADGDPAGAAALLWSVKEAVVKALGCGFHLVDPLHITVSPAAGGEGGYTFPVSLSGKALARFPAVSGTSLRAHSLPQRKMWFSIALLKRGPAVHG